MDVIINNPAGTTQLPAQATPTFQGYGSPYPAPGYGYGYGYGPQHHGPGGFLGGLLLLLGAFLIARFALRRAWMRRAWMGGRPDMARRPEGENTGRNAGGPGPRWPFWNASDEDAALRIARERFARSEISAEEFEAIRKGLQDQG